MMERERVNRPSSEIYVYATNKNFLNIYDALRIDKIKVEVTGYDPETRRQTGHASAWLDRADARLLTHLVAHRLFAPVTGGKWEKFGGSQREDGSIESRTLVVEWDEGDGGRFARNPYRLTIQVHKAGVAPGTSAPAVKPQLMLPKPSPVVSPTPGKSSASTQAAGAGLEIVLPPPYFVSARSVRCQAADFGRLSGRRG